MTRRTDPIGHAHLLDTAGFTPPVHRFAPDPSLAADLGYTDQAHFTHDFRRVTGLTPGEFAAEPGS